MSSDAFRLPVRPRRLPDEAFSSWVQRTAFSNGLRTSDLYPAKPNHNKGWGLPPSNLRAENLTHLALALDVDAALMKTELQREDVKATTSFCPMCLQNQPYFRKTWLSVHTLRCVQHGVHLAERCTHCGSDVPVYRSFLEREHPDQMLRAFMLCRTCQSPLSRSEAEVDQEPEVNWQLHALLTGFPWEPPFPGLTLELEGRVWPVGVLFVLYHQVVSDYTHHGLDVLNVVWEGHADFPQENPLGEYSFGRRNVMHRIRLLRWFLQDWPWRVHRFLRHVAYSTHPLSLDRKYWVSDVLDRFTRGSDPIAKFHFGYMQETLDRERSSMHWDFHCFGEDLESISPFRDLLGTVSVSGLEALPVLNGVDCACARRWKEVHFNRWYRRAYEGKEGLDASPSFGK